ncbi:MAG: hypothetical protein ACR2N4_19480 [Jatrophihabitans sp.]
MFQHRDGSAARAQRGIGRRCVCGARRRRHRSLAAAVRRAMVSAAVWSGFGHVVLGAEQVTSIQRWCASVAAGAAPCCTHALLTAEPLAAERRRGGEPNR